MLVLVLTDYLITTIMEVQFSCMIAAAALILQTTSMDGAGVLSWAKPDRFDEVDSYFRYVNAGTCRTRSKERMVIRPDVVSQLPVYNQLLSKVWYPNRTSLIHLHNMALSRAFFNSYILQKMNDSSSFHMQPNYLYYYLSTAADVNANPNTINGSAFYFDNNCCYPNWFITVPFNRTLALFAPKATRWDDYQDQDNLLREPTRTVVAVKDVGAGTFSNYTHPGYKMNTWYNTWLPDIKGDMDSLTKYTYHVGVKRSIKTGQFLTKDFQNVAFFGPPMPGATERDPRMLPVQWTPPYFDCGGSNKWVVSAVSPVIDYMPRYSNYTHLRRQRVVGLTVMDIDLNQIDFNACGISPGNPGPSYLSGVHRCKKTTSCKHVSGFGLKRGGYKCVCKAGTRYPWSVEPAFMGVDIEQATQNEYEGGFKCEPVNQALVLPIVDKFHGNPEDNPGMLDNFGHVVSDTKESRQKRSMTSWYSRRNDSTSNHRIRTVTADNITILTDNNSRGKYLIKEWDSHRRRQKSIMTDNMKRAGQVTHNKEAVVLGAIHEEKERMLSDHYVTRNSVNSRIETLYQQDLLHHLNYRHAIMTSYVNVTLGREVLRESLVQIRDRHIQRFYSNLKVTRSQSRMRRSMFDEASFDRMQRILRQKARVTAANCQKLPADLLQLPGDVGYGVEKQFEAEGRTALRLSHFLSAYLQNAQPEKQFGHVKGGVGLQEDQLIGEVLANVMANFRILASGLFFDRFKFAQPGRGPREFFGPWAYRQDGSHYVIDTAGLTSQYVHQDWFEKAKATFNGNFAELGTYKIRAHVRSNPKGVSSVRFGFFPLIYKAVNYKQGQWTRPYFRCDGHVNDWVMTYVSPFFALDSFGIRLEFRGVVTVDVPLNRLEINQCPQPFSVANAFKNTARCDYFSTTCSPLAGFPFSRGSYMCSCRLGFEYWHADGKEWFEGTFIELEYQKKKTGVFSRPKKGHRTEVIDLHE